MFSSGPFEGALSGTNICCDDDEATKSCCLGNVGVVDIVEGTVINIDWYQFIPEFI